MNQSRAFDLSASIVAPTLFLRAVAAPVFSSALSSLFGYLVIGMALSLQAMGSHRLSNPPGSGAEAPAADDAFGIGRTLRRGRDTDYSVPPARIPAGGFPALGSCLRS